MDSELLLFIADEDGNGAVVVVAVVVAARGVSFSVSCVLFDSCTHAMRFAGGDSLAAFGVS